MSKTIHETQSDGFDSLAKAGSNMTNASWNYWARKELERQRRKEEEIEVIRASTAQLLRPKQRSQQQQERLKQLKSARDQHKNRHRSLCVSALSSDVDSISAGTSTSYSTVNGDRCDHSESSDPCAESANFAGKESSLPELIASLGQFQRFIVSSEVERVSPEFASIWSIRWTNNLRDHNWATRTVIMATLLTLLFVFLNPDLIATILSWMATSLFQESNRNESALQNTTMWTNENGFEMDLTTPKNFEQKQLPWLYSTFGTSSWILSRCLFILEDLGHLLQLMLCSILHFAVCDISLVYAFDALKIGSITGVEVRNYYVRNVRNLVFMGSAGILVLSIFKAVVNGITDAVVPPTSRLLHQVVTISFSDSPVSYVTEFDGTFLPYLKFGDIEQYVSNERVHHTTELVALLTKKGAEAMNMVLQWLAPLGSFGLGLIATCMAKISFHPWFGNLFFQTFHGSKILSPSPWWSEAFETARVFYAYTAVFLVVLLLLFNVSARFERNQVVTTTEKK